MAANSNSRTADSADDFGKLTADEIELVRTHRASAAPPPSQQSQLPDITRMSASEVAKLPAETISALFKECGKVLAGDQK